jgi:HEPN domain-containing protein
LLSLDYSEVARSFIKEAKVDLRSAQLLKDGEEFSRAIAMCQQAVEKILKAALALKGIIVLEHEVADQFVAAFPEIEGIRELGRIVKALEREGTKTRYPLFGRVDLSIWVPSERYKEEHATKAIDTARFVTQKVIDFIEKEYHLSIGGTK